MEDNSKGFQADFLADFVENCEQTELDGLASPETYAQLLAMYLVQNDLPNAKFLWKRIPDDVKMSTNELQKIWNVGCKMWTKDYSGVYTALKQDWLPKIQPIMAMLEANVKDRLFELVQKAYTSIHADNFSMFLGMDTENAVQFPVKSSDNSLTSERQLGVLTDYVSFLEH